MELAVCVRDGSKIYENKLDKTYVLKNVNIDVPKGFIYALLGPSGCGKTTLLNCIIGFKTFTSGSAWILGEKPGSHSVLTKIGYMPQQISLIDTFSIKECIMFFGCILGLSTKKIKERLEFISKLLLLPDCNRVIGDLSGGQQRRVSLAIALLQEPELLILDEPTVGLDPILRNKIWQFLINLTTTKSITIILTTHYMEEARHAGKIGLMRNGSILYEEIPEIILYTYSSNTLDEAFQKVILSANETMVENYSELPRLTIEDSKEKKFLHMNNLKALLWKNFLWLLKNYIFVFVVFFLPVVTAFMIGYSVGRNPTNLNIGLINYETTDMKLKGISGFIKYYIQEVFKIFIEDYTNACGIDKKVWTIPLKFNSAVYGLDQPNLGDFVCPGILLFTTFFSAAALSCSIMVTERQEGTLERSFVMGIKALEIYTAHFVVLCGVMIIQSICPLFIYFAYFNYTLKGSIFLVTSLTLLCGFCGLCSGFTISSICSNYNTAIVLLCGISTPGFMISGIIWPLESINYYLKFVAFCFPITLPIESLRNILQKGWSFNQHTVLIGYIILLGWALIYIGFSIIIIKFKKK
ncbi:hypothetical protein FQA39_LY00988 [Lamprigera yunnana]|nr:hypothetical protein FQA39_LY00988 [Lamprigera yunnana]